MRLEIRRSGEEAVRCASCGATDLLHAQDAPLTLDVAGLLEVEMLRREIGLARMFRDHHLQVAREHLEQLAVRDLELSGLHDEFARALEGLHVDVPGWRVLRRRREQQFAKRVNEAVAGLLDRTRYPLSGANDEPDRR